MVIIDLAEALDITLEEARRILEANELLREAIEESRTETKQ